MLKSRQAVSAFDEAPDVADETSDVSGDAERAELRALLRAAVRGLNSGEREIIELQAWQGLAAADAAAVLGITRGHAHTLLSRARDQLAASIGVLLVGRTGRRDCPALDTMLTDWDGQLTVLLRKRVSRHIDRCDVCSDRQRRELRPAMLLSLFPGMAAAGAAAEVARHAGTAPAGLKDQLLAMASGQDPTAVAHRVALGQRAGSFGKSGFPKALATSKPVLLRASRGQVITATAGTAAAAAAVTAIVIAAFGGPGHTRLAAGEPPGSPSAAASQPGGGGTGPSTGPTARPSAGASATPPSGALPGRGAGGQAGSGLGSPVSAVAGQGTTSGPGSSSSARSSSPATGSTGSGTPPPSSVPPSSAPPSSPPPPPHTTPPPPPAQGTLDVSPTSIVLTPLLGGTITLSANGGPVNWSISESSSLLGRLSVSPSSGTIAAGHSVQVTIWTSLVSLDSQLTVSPGGQQVTVLVGIGLLSDIGPR